MSEISNASDSIEKLSAARSRILEQLSQIIVGQEEVVEQLLISIFSRGHCLLEGVPGLAKTLMISSLSKTMDLSFSRIQFTPDLMPADITGTEIIEETNQRVSTSDAFKKGLYFRTWFWRMKSIVHHPKPRQPCWRQCKKSKLPSAE